VDRIRDLENDGVIRGYVTLIEPAKVGLPIVAMVSMSCNGE
jgi:DNA-binding Lrp family transcriptional regulator